MTPARILAAIPDNLILRDPNPIEQKANAKALGQWLLDSGHRPSLFEIEQERARRTPTNPRHSEPDNRKART